MFRISGQNVLARTSKVPSRIYKIRKPNFIKTKRLHLSKDNIKGVNKTSYRCEEDICKTYT